MSDMREDMLAQLAKHSATRKERSKTLWAMSREEREAAMWRGELTWGALLYAALGLVERHGQVSRALSRDDDLDASDLLPSVSQTAEDQLVKFAVAHIAQSA